MKTAVEPVEDEKHAVTMRVEVPAEEDVTATIRRTYRDIASRVRIPGFRKGKAPKEVIDRVVGRDTVLNEALREILAACYPKAIDEAGIDPVTSPDIDIEQFEEDAPLIFTARVHVRPEPKLGPYTKLEIEERSAEPTKAEIDDRLERLRDKFASLQVVKRAAKMGDFVQIDFAGVIDGKPFEGGTAADFLLELGSGTFIQGFEAGVVGAKAGEERDVSVKFPEDYRQEVLAGQDVVFHVTVKEVKQKKMPALSDDFAKNVSKFDTIAELRIDIKKELQERKEQEIKAYAREAALKKLVEISKVDLVPAMVDRRMDDMMRDLETRLSMSGSSLGAYAASQGEDVAKLRESFREDATEAVRQQLVLDAFIKKENVVMSEEEIDDEIKRLAEGGKKDWTELKQEIIERDGLGYMRERLTMFKALDLLAAKAMKKKPKTKADAKTKVKKKEEESK